MILLKPNLIILINSVSGKGKALKIGGIIQNELQIRDINFSVFTDTWPEELTGFTEVWLAGGDGTVNYFINRYKECDIPLVVFKGGTGNDFAWKLYGNISLQQQIEIVLNAEMKETDIAICNERLYVNSLGIGFDGEVLRSMGAIRWAGGHLGYLIAVVSKIFSFKESGYKITLPNETIAGRFLLVIVNNSSRTGGGFMVTPNASLTDGKLDTVLCEKLPLFKRLRYLPVIEKGKHIGLPFIHYRQTAAVTIECEKETFAQIDGELISGKTFQIGISNKKLLLKY